MGLPLEFTHLIEREAGDVELAVAASIYDGEIDEISWSPALQLSQSDEDGIWTAAERQLAELRQCAKEEADYYRYQDRQLARMGY